MSYGATGGIRFGRREARDHPRALTVAFQAAIGGDLGGSTFGGGVRVSSTF